MNKGISEVISWVLLISLTVALGTIVGIWTKGQTENVAKDISNTDYQCEDVQFNIKGTGLCEDTDFAFTITNTGSFTIHEFIIRKGDIFLRNGNNIPKDAWLMTLQPGTQATFSTQDLNIQELITGDTIEFLPLLEEVTCGTRKVTFTCP
ncbi:MAG: hypothetical protein Q7R96_00045 [Nanoarchaeota archaeon]|nr:hypothetical protein [Nanoarchaeota archaeon]